MEISGWVRLATVSNLPVGPDKPSTGRRGGKWWCRKGREVLCQHVSVRDLSVSLLALAEEPPLRVCLALSSPSPAALGTLLQSVCNPTLRYQGREPHSTSSSWLESEPHGGALWVEQGGFSGVMCCLELRRAHCRVLGGFGVDGVRC